MRTTVRKISFGQRVHKLPCSCTILWLRSIRLVGRMRNQNHAPQFASWIGSRKESDRKLPGIRAVPVGVRSRTHREATMPKKSITALYAEFEKALAILDACRYQHDET